MCASSVFPLSTLPKAKEDTYHNDGPHRPCPTSLLDLPCRPSAGLQAPVVDSQGNQDQVPRRRRQLRLSQLHAHPRRHGKSRVPHLRHAPGQLPLPREKQGRPGRRGRSADQYRRRAHVGHAAQVPLRFCHVCFHSYLFAHRILLLSCSVLGANGIFFFPSRDIGRALPVTQTSNWCAQNRRDQAGTYLAPQKWAGQSRRCFSKFSGACISHYEACKNAISQWCSISTSF